MLAFLPACLVTDKPDLEPATTTRPQLIENQPRTTEFLQRKLGEVLNFDAQVLSEDAGDFLTVVLLIDYGQEQPTGEPYKDAEAQAAVRPGTLSVGPRDVKARYPIQAPIAVGCHTVTLLVTHTTIGETELGAQLPQLLYCPVDSNDYDTLTWFLSVCDDQGDCPFDCPFDDGTFTYCPTDPGGAAVTP